MHREIAVQSSFLTTIQQTEQSRYNIIPGIMMEEYCIHNEQQSCIIYGAKLLIQHEIMAYVVQTLYTVNQSSYNNNKAGGLDHSRKIIYSLGKLENTARE